MPIVPIAFLDVDDSVSNFLNTTDKWYRSMVMKVQDQPDKYSQWRVEDGILRKYVRCLLPELSEEADYWKIVVPKEVKKRIAAAEERNRRVYNLRRRHVEYTAGDRLWRRNKQSNLAFILFFNSPV